MKVITRFAPSPTGYLHIGGVRTALFNYLFAKHFNGKFLLRIEDTDKERFSEKAVEAIFKGLDWLRLDYDGDPIFQSANKDRHVQIVYQLLEEGKAYYCFSSQEEIEVERNKALSNKQNFIFKSPWRDNISLPSGGIKPVIRLKAEREGRIIIADKLQGNIEVSCDHLDDMVLLRGDLTPTYMLAVVVDDHDMDITHIIRGDDHLTNAARQLMLYKMLGWQPPIMVHVPLIYGEDGAKLSKRHGAPAVEEYKEMGYLPEAMCNYLLRLGFAHGDEEIITRTRAIEIFDINGLNKAPARLNTSKLNFLNSHYLRNKSDGELMEIIKHHIGNISEASYNNIYKGLNEIKLRSQLLPELAELSSIYNIDKGVPCTTEAINIINGCDVNLIKEVIERLAILPAPDKSTIQQVFKDIAQAHGLKLGELMLPVRALITGKTVSPSVFEIIEIIGVNKAIERLKAACN